MNGKQLLKLGLLSLAFEFSQEHKKVIESEILGLVTQGYELEVLQSFLDITLNDGNMIDDLFEYLTENPKLIDLWGEVKYEFRNSGESSNLPSQNRYSRYFELETVVKKIGDKWLCWDYFYGGGKHSYPEDMEWEDTAKIVNCVEEEVTIIKKTFTHAE